MSSAISVCHGEFGRAALYRLNKELIMHAHREGHLIFHIEGSVNDLVIGTSTFELNYTQAAAVSPLEPHSHGMKSSDPSVVLVLYIKPIWFSENSQSSDFTLRFGRAKLVRTPAIDDLVRQFTSRLSNSQNVEHIDSLLFELTRLCYEQTWQDGDAPGLLQSKRPHYSDFRIHRSLRIMQKCISAEVEMEAVARAVGLSRPHFFKLFKKQLGITPNVYLNTLRSERAIDELVNTEKTVTNIAHELGYSSQASFTRFFSSNVGIAPTEYRRVAERPSVQIPV